MLVGLLASLFAIAVTAAHLKPEAAVAWTTYLSATESRIARELRSPRGFLAIDFQRDAATERRAVLGGAVVVQREETLDARGEKIDVPFARIHHWRGDVMIPGVAVAQLVAQLENGALPRQDDVVQSSVLERGPNRLKVYLRLRRTMIVTVVYNTEHLVTFAHDGSSRATSTSVATKIAEIADPDTPEEREISAGDDRGFLWRLSAYWRYEDVPGGLIAECESVGLSREVPSVARYFINPIIESTAKESMTRTLLAMRAYFGTR